MQDPDQAENAAVKLVSEGLAKVRETSNDEALKEAQEAAKGAGKGLWASDASSKVRNVIWEVENPRQLVDKFAGKPIKAVVEHVRDGTTIRVFLLPDFYHVMLMMSGVRVSRQKTRE
jgi:staphylococcal nuclease domain-containing protein 1